MLGKNIMIIGGTGALGKNLIRRLYVSNRLTVFSRDEHKQYFLSKEYPNVNFMIGNINDISSIERAIETTKPDIIINAAALKHVPICESNVYESIKTNILGHQNLIDCVVGCNHHIETLIFISTDKACSPINVYGMCKSLSERLYVNLANSNKEFKVVITRYGNVLESTGSVIPFFKKLLENDECESLPITHNDMTRFLMTLDEAVDLILWSYEHNDSHGRIVVPKMNSLKIHDLAKSLAMNLSHNHISMVEIGKRPGEKIHECMINEYESLRTIDYGKYFMICDSIINNEEWTYSSEDNVLNFDDIEKFLKTRGVL